MRYERKRTLLAESHYFPFPLNLRAVSTSRVGFSHQIGFQQSKHYFIEKPMVKAEPMSHKFGFLRQTWLASHWIRPWFKIVSQQHLRMLYKYLTQFVQSLYDRDKKKSSARRVEKTIQNIGLNALSEWRLGGLGPIGSSRVLVNLFRGRKREENGNEAGLPWLVTSHSSTRLVPVTSGCSGFIYIYIYIFNHYSAKARVISLNT